MGVAVSSLSHFQSSFMKDNEAKVRQDEVKIFFLLRVLYIRILFCWQAPPLNLRQLKKISS